MTGPRYERVPERASVITMLNTGCRIGLRRLRSAQDAWTFGVARGGGSQEPASLVDDYPVMMRTRIAGAVSLILLTGAISTAAAGVSKPLIKGEEVGYFGGATVTHQVDVFVYSNLGPRAGNRVTVCLYGKCEAARGHNASTAWYSAAFTTRGLRMGDPVKFSVVASNSAGRSSASVTRMLLCMHNNGSTPQH